MSEPVLVALLFADRIITENNNKKGIIGTFTKFYAPAFPFAFPPWGIYTAFTNIAGKHPFALTLTRVESSQVVLPINGEFENEHAEDVVELTFNLGGVLFPGPGRYSMTLHIDGELLGSRILYVEQMAPPEGAEGREKGA